jgi:hypothetical protein
MPDPKKALDKVVQAYIDLSKPLKEPAEKEAVKAQEGTSAKTGEAPKSK